MEVGHAEQAGDLLPRAQAGEGRAFEELLEPVLDQAFRLAITMLKDRGAAEDAVQEAALKAWRKIGRFRPGADLRPWLLAIVANECRSVRRSAWWRVVRAGDVAAGPAPGPWDAAAAAPVAPAVVFGSPQVGYATVRGGLQRTLDGGLHWTPLRTPGTGP